MRRIAFRIALSLWLLSVAASAVLWLRSYRVSDIARWTGSQGRTLGLQSSRGQLMAGSVRVIPPPVGSSASGVSPFWSPGWSFESTSTTDLNEPFPWAVGLDLRLARFRIISVTVGSVIQTRGIAVPFWFIVLLEGLPFLMVLRRRRRARLIRLRMCLQCGYDLRASAARCPECGTPIPAAN